MILHGGENIQYHQHNIRQNSALGNTGKNEIVLLFKMTELYIFRKSNLWLKAYSENTGLLRTEFKNRVQFLSAVKHNLYCSLRHIVLTQIKLEKMYKRNRENYNVTHFRRNVGKLDYKVFLLFFSSQIFRKYFVCLPNMCDVWQRIFV